MSVCAPPFGMAAIGRHYGAGRTAFYEVKMNMPIYKRCSRCGKRIQSGSRCPCQKERHREYDRYSRDNKSKKFYDSAEWQRIRENVLDIDQYIDVYMYMTEEITMNADDESSYVGTGWVTVEKIDGVKFFTANILVKVKYSEPSEEYATKGDSIEYKTPSISGRALKDDDGTWKKIKQFDTEKEALDYIYKFFEGTTPQETV